MDRDMLTDPLIFKTVLKSEGIVLSEETVERIIDLQRRYQRINHSIDFCDFLLKDEIEVTRRIEGAERYLISLTARRSYEN